MSQRTDQFEQDIVTSIRRSLPYTDFHLPSNLPNWMLGEGIVPSSRVISVDWVGSSGSKTDVLIRLEDSRPIKISAKLSSADYFGNWYSHTRILEEFGEDAFYRLVSDCTNWANSWKDNPAASMFVGVSVCFGKRTGNTQREFTDVFNYEDIVKIVAGYGSGDHIANCLYVSSSVPRNISDLFDNIEPINEDTILQLSSNFKIAYRPINPLTEGTNRGKCIYTEFRPFNRLPNMTNITELSNLIQLGEFVEVEANSINHNRLLNQLESHYNIFIPRK